MTRRDLKGQFDIIYAGSFETVGPFDEPVKSKSTAEGTHPKSQARRWREE